MSFCLEMCKPNFFFLAKLSKAKHGTSLASTNNNNKRPLPLIKQKSEALYSI